MVKTRLSKVLAMLLALTMVLSTMVIDFTAFADNANVPFTVTAKVDNTNYNKGDTVTVEYYATAEANQNIGSYQFKVAYDASKLTLESLVNNLTGGTSKSSTTSGKVAWAREGEGAVVIGAAEVKLATATFKTKHDATAEGVAISADAIEITPQGYDGNVAPTVVPTAVNLWNITVTFSGDTGIENNVTGTAYVKYNEAGLYTSNDYNATYTPVDAVAKNTYRLYDTTEAKRYWLIRGEHKSAAEIAQMTFTANATALATTVKQYTITFEAGEGSFVGNAPSAIIIDTGKKLSTVELPGAGAFNAPDGKNFAGFKIKNTETVVNGETVVESDLVLVAIYADGEYAWSTTPNQSTINVTAGVTGNKVKHGTDVKFTVTANDGYVVEEVRYSVGGGSSNELQAEDDGSYKIPGSAITGNIAVEVITLQYHTVTFKKGTGVVAFDDIKYVVAHGTKTLYANTDDLLAKQNAVSVPTTVADTGYRLPTDASAAEGKWNDGVNNVTVAQIQDKSFEADAVYTARAIKVWTVTFTAGANGTLAAGAVESITRDDGYVLQASDIPAYEPAAGYVFDKWVEGAQDTVIGETLVGQEIKADKAYKVTFKDGTYKVNFATLNGVSVIEKTGLDGESNAVHGTAVTFKLNVNPEVVSVSKVYYTVNGNETKNYIGPAEGTGIYTIPGDKITAVINVGYESTDMIAVNLVSGANVTGIVPATLYVVQGGYLSAEQVNSIVATYAPGWEFENWYDSENEVVADLKAVPINAETSFTLKAKKSKRTITADGLNVTYTEGYTDADAVIDVPVKFTITKDGAIVTKVYYKVGTEGSPVEAAQVGGVYTIPGTAILDNIAITVDSVAGSFEFITRNEYKALVTENADKQIVVFNTAKLPENHYAIATKAMYWSEKYNAYVAWVGATATAQTLAPTLETLAGEAEAIAYTGDINNDGNVTAADAGIINDCLQGQRISTTTEKMLFMLDYDAVGEGLKVITTKDMVDVLTEAVK